MKKKEHRFQRALTIEYAIVLMALVAAFVGLIFTIESLLTENATDYSDYIEEKKFLDEVGAVYIGQQGADGCLDDYENNEFNYRFAYNSSYLLVRWGSGQATVRLHIMLGADADGDGQKDVEIYRYGP